MISASSAIRSIATFITRHELLLLLIATPLLMFQGPWSWLGLLLILLPWPARWLAPGRITVSGGLDLAIAILLLMTMVGYGVSPDRSASQEGLWRLLLGIAWFYGLINTVRNRDQLRWLTWFLLAAGAGLVLLSLTGTDWQKVRLIELDFYRYLPRVPWNSQLDSLANPRVVGMALAMLCPLFLAIVLLAQDRLLRLASALLGALMILALVLTQSPQGLIGLGAALALLLVVRSRWFLLLVLPLVTGAIWAALTVDWHPVAASLLSIQDTAGVGVVLRLDIWSRALAMIADMPLTGAGLDSFPLLQAHFYPGFLLGQELHAHNLYFQIALDLGLIGLLAFLWLLFSFGFSVVRTDRLNSDPDVRALLLGSAAGVLSMAVSGLVDTVWAAKPALLFWILLGTGMAAALLIDRGANVEADVTVRRPGIGTVVPGLLIALLLVALVFIPGVFQKNSGLVQAHRAIYQARSGSISVENLQQAIDRLLLAEGSTPYDPDIPARLGSLYAWQGRMPEALAALQQRVLLDMAGPTDRYAPFVGWQRHLAGEDPGSQLDDFVRIYSYWMNRYPERAEGYVQLAILRQQYGGNQAAAIATLRTGLEKGAQPTGLIRYHLEELERK